MSQLFRSFVAEEEGQDVVEYVLLMAMIALASAAAFPDLSASLTGAFNTAIAMLESV